MAFRTSHALAGQLGTTPVTFGGDPDAVTTHPEAFAATLEAPRTRLAGARVVRQSTRS